MHVTDATPNFLKEFYDVPISPDEIAAEERVLQNASRVIYSSDFMATRSIHEFNLQDKRRITTIPFGANFDDPPQASIVKLNMNPFKLFYVGTSWTRKGGEIAVETLNELQGRGVPTELTLVGEIPNDLPVRSDLRLVGQLDKNKKTHLDQLRVLFGEAHLLVLPTRADCTPMVVAEANAFGTPSLVTDVGGVRTLVEPGLNGDVLPLEAGYEQWSDKICQLTSDHERYAELSETSFRHANERLSWDAWAQSIVRSLTKKFAIPLPKNP